MTDDSTWRFTIRKDLRWPTGDRVNADDIEFTVDNVISNPRQAAAADGARLAAVLVDRSLAG